MIVTDPLVIIRPELSTIEPPIGASSAGDVTPTEKLVEPFPFALLGINTA